MKKLGALMLLLALAGAGRAQNQSTSAEVYLGLKKLNVLNSVLYVAAHPDDENTRLLTYFSKDRLLRTGYLSLTRGDGGQNLIGDEQGVELGLIRTQELLAARRVDGAEQFFSRAYDFGYSKTPDETFEKWNHEKILSDVVWVIRNFQPDIIITRFPVTGEGGHGHHTASAILANEAFQAAADPKRFPEQLAYVQPWQAKRVLWNTFNFGGTNTTSPDQLTIDAGGYNPVLGKSYGEIAAESRSQHKSQGFGVARTRGEALEYFKNTAGTAPERDLFEGVATGWQRVPGGTQIASMIDNLISAFDFMAPQKSVPGLVQLHKSLKALPQSYWRDQKLAEVQDLILSASGLYVDAYTSEPFVALTDSARVFINLNSRLGTPVQLLSVQIAGRDTVMTDVLQKNKNLSFSRSFFVPQNMEATRPYWLAIPMQEGSFTVNDQQLIGRADLQPAFTTRFKLRMEGEDFTVDKAVRYKSTDPVKGELYQPFYVIPPVSITTDPKVILALTKEAPKVNFHVESYKNLTGNFHLQGTGNDEVIKGLPSTISKGRKFEFSFPQAADKEGKVNTIAFTSGQSGFANGFKIIRHDHIPDMIVPTTSAFSVKAVDLKTYNKKIGYIVGAGDKVPEALEQMGYEVTILGEKELARYNLAQFDAILTGVRAYNTNEWLNNAYEKLMQYVENGGNLIVQYNTSNQIGPVRARIGPYNFNITRNRITNEQAEVTFLKPEHPVLNFPNKITADDFKGWIQERSIYHADAADKKFESIFRMHDPGEAADDGSLIIAPYGKGYFTYTGLVFFRELPAGVPGAYRLLANIIALNRKKEF